MAIYQQALQADPSIAKPTPTGLQPANRAAGLGALLPQINGFGQYNRDKPDGSFTNIDPNTGLYVPSQSRSDTKTKYWQRSCTDGIPVGAVGALKRSSSELPRPRRTTRQRSRV